jgi:putative transposase
MAEKFRNKYRVPSARFQNWDYGSNGAYFITICTKEMQHFFGEVVDKKMILNSVGSLAEEYWIEIPKQFPYVELGNFQVMPNHLHGILIIDKSVVVPVETRFIASNSEGNNLDEARFIGSVSNFEKNNLGETRLIGSNFEAVSYTHLTLPTKP